MYIFIKLVILSKCGAIDNTNAFYENISKIQKEKIISKITFIDDLPYKILFHFIKNNEYILLIKAYNQTDLKCCKEIKISHEKFLQILTKINIDEILPKNVLPSFINNYELLTEKILVHTSYLFKNAKSIKIGLSPKAVGMLFYKKYTFEFLDCKSATVDFIVLKKMHLRIFIINDIIKYK